MLNFEMKNRPDFNLFWLFVVKHTYVGKNATLKG
jgi:hypothetical protein